MVMQSVLKSLQVFEKVAEMQPVRVGELAPALKLAKSTAQRNLQTLAEAGWIRAVGDDYTRWAVSPHLEALILRTSSVTDLREAALEVMLRLRDETGESIQLAVPSARNQIVTIERVDSLQSVRSVTPLGAALPKIGTSAGIAMLAHGTDQAVRSLMAESNGSAVDGAPMTVEDALRLVAKARSDGYSIRLHEPDKTVFVSAAIQDFRGDVVAGITAAFPVDRFDQDNAAQWGAKVRLAARAVGERLGYRTEA